MTKLTRARKLLQSVRVKDQRFMDVPLLAFTKLELRKVIVLLMSYHNRPSKGVLNGLKARIKGRLARKRGRGAGVGDL